MRLSCLYRPPKMFSASLKKYITSIAGPCVPEIRAFSFHLEIALLPISQCPENLLCILFVKWPTFATQFTVIHQSMCRHQYMSTHILILICISIHIHTCAVNNSTVHKQSQASVYLQMDPTVCPNTTTTITTTTTTTTTFLVNILYLPQLCSFQYVMQD